MPIPTDLSVGRSHAKRFREILPRLQERFAHAIFRVSDYPHARVTFTRLLTAEWLEKLIAYLEQSGIPEDAISLTYPERGADAVRDALASGLRDSALAFGGDVAEKDVGLQRYFVETEAYRAVETLSKHIVVGPKGSGKSAILKSLTQDNRNALIITPEHYAAEVLRAIQGDGNGAGMNAYISTWKYTLLVEVFRTLVQGRSGDARALATLRSALAAHGYLEGDLSLLERFLGYLRRISKLTVKYAGAEATVDSVHGDLAKLFKMDDLAQLIPALKAALRRQRFTIYIDELDQSWDNSEAANKFLVSLLIAAIQLQGLDENLHIVVFLRSEIFDLLKPHLAQLDKYRSDIEALRWRREELMSLVAQRALDSLDLNPNVGAAEVLRLLFDPIPDAGCEGFDYIVSRTSARPREVIQFCNLALGRAKSQGYSRISADAILAAEEEFSDWKLEHVASEHLHILPRLDLLLETLRGKPRILSHAALDSILADLLLGREARQLPDWFSRYREPGALMQLLYALEVIGIARASYTAVDHRQPWHNYEFAYSRSKGKPEVSPSFIFHPGIWKALELN